MQVQYFLDVKQMRVVLGEAITQNAICLERYGGGGDGNNEVQTIDYRTLTTIRTVDDPTGGVSGIITGQPAGAVVDYAGDIYSGTRNNDNHFKKFDKITNAQVTSLFNGPWPGFTFANWIPDSTATRHLIVCSADSPMKVYDGMAGTLLGTAVYPANSSMIGACYDSSNHLWVFYVDSNGATADTYVLDVTGAVEYTLPGGAGYGAYRAMWNSTVDHTLVFLTKLGYLVKWDVNTHAIVGAPTLHSELSGIADQIGCDMAKYMNNLNTGKLWLTQNDGFTLASYNLQSLAINAADTTNLRTAFAGIPNFQVGAWVNTPPCGFLPTARTFVGWAEPGGSNHYTWYLASFPAPISNRMIFINT